MAYYSGTQNEIETVLRTLGIGAGTLDDLAPDDVARSQGDIDQRINSALSMLYYTPLKLITRNGTQKYPDPIPELARRMVAADLIINTLTDVASNIIATAEAMSKESKRDLFNLANGITGANWLDGQIKKTRNHFMPPNIAPASEPIPNV